LTTKPQPAAAYYAVIPASVRYDKNIPQGAKLLYGEISSLCNKEGYCWAGNEYFVNLYQTTEKTIRNWIGALRDAGHITVSFTYVSGKKEIESRILRLTETKKSERTKKQPDSGQEVREEFTTGGENNCHTSGIDLPQTREKLPVSSHEVGKKFTGGGEKIFHTSGKIFPEVGKNSSEGGENFYRDNITSINTTTSSSSDPPETHPQPPPDEAAEAPLLPQELKDALTALDPLLILSADFYPRAAAYMAANGLDLPYLPFLYAQCKAQNPRSIRGLYYTLFFDDTMPELYKANKRSNAPPPPPPDMPCPVCGTLHAQRDDACPSCGLPKNASADTLLLFRQLHTFPPDKREEYLRREKDIIDECGLKDPLKYKSLIASLQKEFGFLETA